MITGVTMGLSYGTLSFLVAPKLASLPDLRYLIFGPDRKSGGPTARLRSWLKETLRTISIVKVFDICQKPSK